MEIARKMSPMGLMDGFVGFTGFNTLHSVIKEQTQNGHMANNFTALFHAGDGSTNCLILYFVRKCKNLLLITEVLLWLFCI